MKSSVRSRARGITLLRSNPTCVRGADRNLWGCTAFGAEHRALAQDKPNAHCVGILTFNHIAASFDFALDLVGLTDTWGRPMLRNTECAMRHGARRWRRAERSVVALSLTLILSACIAGPAAARSLPTQPSHPVASGLPSWVTKAVENLAQKYLTKKYAKKLAKSAAIYAAKREFNSWKRSNATDCSALPFKFFCAPPPSRVWGRGMALRIDGDVPGQFAYPSAQIRSSGSLVPGVVYWLTCWSAGPRITNHAQWSTLWYQLTNKYWVSDAWLDTGTFNALPGVAHC